jgi:ribosomal protein S18 acetylase RimI-like enzyme
MNPAVEPEEAFVARCAPWMAERLASAGPWYAWVVDSKAGVGGCLWLQIIEKVPNPAAELEIHGYITNVYVRAELRGRGAGSRLMDAAMAFCRERGVDSVVLWPTERSRSLYERYGFVSAPGDVMEAVLDPGRDVH